MRYRDFHSSKQFWYGRLLFELFENLPIEHVNIEKFFVNKMRPSEKDRWFIETILKLAHTIGLRVVAKGVEHYVQFEVLEHLNCELIQGYSISKTVNFEEVIHILQQNK